MTFNELKRGEYYFSTRSALSNIDIIFRSEGVKKIGANIHPKFFSYITQLRANQGGARLNYLYDFIRLATYEEKMHLLECEAKGKFVPFEIRELYQIF